MCLTNETDYLVAGGCAPGYLSLCQPKCCWQGCPVSLRWEEVRTTDRDKGAWTVRLRSAHWEAPPYNPSLPLKPPHPARFLPLQGSCSDVRAHRDITASFVYVYGCMEAYACV